MTTPHKAWDIRAWSARLVVGTVFVINVQSALGFIIWPERYIGGFELAGIPGEIALKGLRIAFLMWNATYPLVIWNPRRYRVLFGVVLVQQLIGLVGESWLLLSLPVGHSAISASLTRFIVFDGVGLALMALIFLMLRARTDAH